MRSFQQLQEAAEETLNNVFDRQETFERVPACRPAL